MHIKSIVIDGFKSYEKRVELNNFDPEFNAITGLNGTGKSNILDAICFALGISSMNTIRASDMREVIYKNGQAGVHTATVIIHFDNTDKSRSAPHYRHHDEIVISREVGMNYKNTYRMNGYTVPAKKITDFFKSLQMNVNNPHFIIMQGRITKVLNMKPVEILSMIEEAAGTKMYEYKKKGLELIVDRRDRQLREVQDTADEEIVPTMETFDKEKKMAEELNNVHISLKQKITKLENWNYLQFKVVLQKNAKDLDELKSRELQKIEHKSSIECQINEMNQIVIENEELLKKESGKKLNEFKIDVENTIKVKNEIESKINELKCSINCEDGKIEDFVKQIQFSKNDLEAKKKEINDFRNMNAGFDKEIQNNKSYLDVIDKKIRALNSGNIFDDKNGYVQENIDKYSVVSQNQQMENQQYIIKIDGLNKKLNEKLIGIQDAQTIYEKQMASLKGKEKEYDKINSEYNEANEELSCHNNIRNIRDGLFREIRDLTSKVESFESYNSNLFFRYNDPWPNFDRRKVHGLICRLFKPIDFKFELALTTLAGGKLYFVVVDDDRVGKDILEANKFPNRMNFIPLNKIQSYSLPDNVICIAQQIGGADKVFPAMSLIKYDNKHLKAIQWIFGQSFICTTKEVAEKVCFDSRINRHCFTLDGDHFNPAGSLTGGANTQRLILKLIASQNEIISRLEAKKIEFAKIDNKLAAMANLSKRVSELRDRQITVQEELANIKSDIHLGQAHQQVIEVNDIKDRMAELEKKLAEGKINEKQLLTKIRDLDTKMKNANAILKKQLSDANKSRIDILRKINNHKSEYEEKKYKCNKLELEIKDLINQIQEEENQLAELNAEKTKLDDDLITLTSKLHEATIIYKKANNDYTTQNEEVKKNMNENEKLTKSIKSLKSDIETTSIDLLDIEACIDKLELKIEKIQNSFDELDKRLPNDQKQIASKMDFNNFNPGEWQQSVNTLQVRFDQLSKTVNPDKLNNFHKYIQDYKKLEEKLKTVGQDKNILHEIITELEVKKREHLQTSSDCVNKEFGKIFSSVLPGAQACLKQVDPEDITAGLQIRVAFNGLWKDSLDELSGGERSLVALSLVLAMLKFNPVPLYILDEVDAALDLTHTQNIGKMLKQHFKQSQFIVVSLKDGMFSNANVLFRTKFVDGSSAVTRTTRKQT